MTWALQHTTRDLSPLLSHMEPPDHIPVLDRSILDDAETVQDLAREMGCSFDCQS
jgi:hypothetical protein